MQLNEPFLPLNLHPREGNPLKNLLTIWRGISHCPKDPAVLKIVRVVNLLRVLFLVRRGPLLSRRVLCGHHFPGNYRHFSSQRRVRGVLNLGGVVKTLRRSNSLYLLSRRSNFSTEGSFGWAAKKKTTINRSSLLAVALLAGLLAPLCFLPCPGKALSAPHRCVCVCVCDGHPALPVATSLRCDSW